MNTNTTSNNRATHAGTCQVCGAQHKVNIRTGRLAQHGYTVQFGQFNGVCRGAEELPFQKSCELVKWSIASANMQIADTCEKIDALRSGEGTLIYRFEAGKGRNRYHVWHECRIEKSEQRGFDVVALIGGHVQNLSSMHRIEKVEEYVRELAIRHYDTELRAMRSYVKSQEERLIDWQVRELIPLTQIEEEKQSVKDERAAQKEQRRQNEIERKRKAEIRENWSDLAWRLWYFANVTDRTETQTKNWTQDKERMTAFLVEATGMSEDDVLAEARKKMKRL